jgi:hypothetical protein
MHQLLELFTHQDQNNRFFSIIINSKPESFEGNDLIPPEKDAMIVATCDDKVNGDSRFGPVYAGKPNFDFYIVKCPNGCADGGKINVRY